VRAQDSVEQLHDARVPLRNEPVQARSTARLAALLDAAAAVVDEIGYERLTTAMVAERAGASIGTVYRYFPDRIALLQALGARNLDRVLGSLAIELQDARHTDWATAVRGATDVIVAAFRSEPGFRSIRVGDVIDLRPAPNDRTFLSVVSDRILDAVVSRFGVNDSTEIRFAFETAIDVIDGLSARAFLRDSAGDARVLATTNELVYSILVAQLGEGSARA
jgi:AcrR family transcriptional regulator